MRKASAIAVSVLAVAACSLIGGANGPQKPSRALWYLALRKPPLTPPGPAVGATWGVLELLLAAAGSRLLRRPPSGGRDMALAGWSAVLAGLAGFPWLFFRRRRLGASTAVAGAMLGACGVSMVAARRVDGAASALLAPVAAWLAFATVLSGRLWAKNRWLSAD